MDMQDNEMTVWAFLNEKGGVGKTTTATTFACGMAKRGKRVLLIDADPQANATSAFGIKPYAGFYDFLYRQVSIANCVKAVDPARISPEAISGNLWIMGGNIETRNLVNQLDDVNGLLDKILELSEMNTVDIVVIDTPPTPTLMTNAVYLASDKVVYPVRLETWSMEGLQRSYQYLDRVNRHRAAENLSAVEFAGIIPTATRLSTNEHTANFKALVDRFGWIENGGKVLHPLPLRTAWVESTAIQASIFLTGDQQATLEANRFVDEVYNAETA